MDTDVEMQQAQEIREKSPSKSPSLVSLPPPSPSTHTSRGGSPIAVDDDRDGADGANGDSAKSSDTALTTVDGEEKSGVAEPKSSADAPGANPGPVATSAKPASTSTKPKSTKAARPRSRSPTLPPPAPILQTIRLDITLGGPDAYEIDVSQLAKTSGQRPPTPPPSKIDTSDSEGGDDEGSGKDGNSKEQKKKRRKKHDEYYDLQDPFIDDSDLALDNRTHFAQTKQQGFYVSSGEVALLKEKTPVKKPRSRKLLLSVPPGSYKRENLDPSASLALAGPSSSQLSIPPTAVVEGTKDSPIAVPSDGEEDKNGLKRKASGSVSFDGKKKRKTFEIRPFHPELEKAIDGLKEAIAKESWSVKGKFPPALKPILADVAIKAIALEEYDDNFFNLMPQIFPYNRFTMAKLIKRTVFADHVRILHERQEELLRKLGEMAQEGFPKAQEEYEKSVVAWEKRQEKVKAEAEGSGEGTPGTSVPPGQPPLAQTQSLQALTDPEGGDDSMLMMGTQSGIIRDNHPPGKKFKLTDEMRNVIWHLVCLSNECCRIENEKNSLENSPLQVSEQGSRKTLYQKMVATFPEGWMTSGQISREVSAMKKRYEREALENEN